MVQTVTSYLCELCHNVYYSEEEAKKCESQPAQVILAKGTVFMNFYMNEPFKDLISYCILRSYIGLSENDHKNMYSAAVLHKSNGQTTEGSDFKTVIVNKAGLTIDWGDCKSPPTIVSPSELEKLCSEDPVFREKLQKIMEDTKSYISP